MWKKESSEDWNTYKTILKLYTSKNKITGEDKALLRKHQTENKISKKDHFYMLNLLDWTEDEWEDGEKALHFQIDFTPTKKVIILI